MFLYLIKDENKQTFSRKKGLVIFHENGEIKHEENPSYTKMAFMRTGIYTKFKDYIYMNYNDLSYYIHKDVQVNCLEYKKGSFVKSNPSDSSVNLSIIQKYAKDATKKNDLTGRKYIEFPHLISIGTKLRESEEEFSKYFLSLLWTENINEIRVKKIFSGASILNERLEVPENYQIDRSTNNYMAVYKERAQGVLEFSGIQDVWKKYQNFVGNFERTPDNLRKKVFNYLFGSISEYLPWSKVKQNLMRLLKLTAVVLASIGIIKLVFYYYSMKGVTSSYKDVADWVKNAGVYSKLKDHVEKALGYPISVSTFDLSIGVMKKFQNQVPSFLQTLFAIK